MGRRRTRTLHRPLSLLHWDRETRRFFSLLIAVRVLWPHHQWDSDENFNFKRHESSTVRDMLAERKVSIGSDEAFEKHDGNAAGKLPGRSSPWIATVSTNHGESDPNVSHLTWPS